MPASAALLRILDHRRIAAQHRMRILGRHRNARPRLETAIFDCGGNPSRERVGMRLAAYHRHIGERTGMRAADIGDDIAIRQFLGMANRVDKHDARKALPRIGRAQHRQERSDAGSRGEAPQHVGRRDFADAEESVRAGRARRIADPERGKPGVNSPPGTIMKIELVRLFVRRVH